MNTRTLIITFVWMIMSNIGIFAQEHWDAQERIELNKGVFPKNFSKAIDIIQYDLLGIERGKSHVKVIDNNTLYINLSFSAKIVIIFVNLIFLTPYLPIMVTWR